MSWHPESHPTRQKHFEERGLTQWNNPRLGCGAEGPSAQNNDQVRRARGNKHVLIKCLCTDRVVGSDDVAASDNIGALSGTHGWQKGSTSGSL